MGYKDFMEKQDFLRKQIEAENTGTAGELARKLNVSRRTLFSYFRWIEAEKCCVKFCRHRRTYYFSSNESEN